MDAVGWGKEVTWACEWSQLCIRLQYSIDACVRRKDICGGSPLLSETRRPLPRRPFGLVVPSPIAQAIQDRSASCAQCGAHLTEVARGVLVLVDCRCAAVELQKVNAP